MEVLGKNSAKAIGKVADTTSKAIDAGMVFGQYLAKYCGYPLEQGMGLWGDKFYYRRIENLLKFMEITSGALDTLGIQVLHPLDLKIGIPLLEAASLENEESLRKLWANLLVNSVNSKNKTKIHPAFVQVLQNLQPEEATLLQAAYKKATHTHEVIHMEIEPYDQGNITLETKMVSFAHDTGISSSSNEDILAWFDNLIRLELLKRNDEHESIYNNGMNSLNHPEEPYVETYFHKVISISAFGRKFAEAVSEIGPTS